MQLDGVVILDIDRQEIELIGDDLDDVDNLPSEAVSIDYACSSRPVQTILHLREIIVLYLIVFFFNLFS
jgi:hypothetical protein